MEENSNNHTPGEWPQLRGQAGVNEVIHLRAMWLIRDLMETCCMYYFDGVNGDKLFSSAEEPVYR